MTFKSTIESFTRERCLPAGFTAQALEYHVPLASWIYSQWPTQNIRVFGINSAQGSGKTTLAGLLEVLLQAEYGLASRHALD